mmetsp:Transcript_43262/g.94688  ORF Transcript_43262/g.94688 Transcript_43262/m.94688 type:complete len:219 (-) Transcript_43262:342-998(-)
MEWKGWRRRRRSSRQRGRLQPFARRSCRRGAASCRPDRCTRRRSQRTSPFSALGAAPSETPPLRRRSRTTRVARARATSASRPTAPCRRARRRPNRSVRRPCAPCSCARTTAAAAVQPRLIGLPLVQAKRVLLKHTKRRALKCRTLRHLQRNENALSEQALGRLCERALDAVDFGTERRAATAKRCIAAIHIWHTMRSSCGVMKALAGKSVTSVADAC